MTSSDTRSENTRQRLLEAGLELFAARGVEGVTTRALAQRAGVNQAAIPYHFGGKDGVYLAVAEHIVALAQPRLHAIFNEIKPALATRAADPAALLERYMLALARLMLEPPLTTDAFGFLLREQFQPGAAFALLYRELLEPAHRLCGELLTALLGGTDSEVTTILLEHAFMGQITAFVFGRATLQQRLQGKEVQHAAVAAALLKLLRAFIVGALETRPSNP